MFSSDSTLPTTPPAVYLANSMPLEHRYPSQEGFVGSDVCRNMPAANACQLVFELALKIRFQFNLITVT